MHESEGSTDSWVEQCAPPPGLFVMRGEPGAQQGAGHLGSLGGIGGTAGWLIGGPLTDFSWSWIFFLNVPIGTVALLLAPRLLRESLR
jgi:hypothetical protein